MLMIVDKKRITIYVPPEFDFTGGEVKNELNDFFQWIVDNHPDIFQKHERGVGETKAGRVRAILGGW